MTDKRVKMMRTSARNDLPRLYHKKTPGMIRCYIIFTLLSHNLSPPPYFQTGTLFYNIIYYHTPYIFPGATLI